MSLICLFKQSSQFLPRSSSENEMLGCTNGPKKTPHRVGFPCPKHKERNHCISFSELPSNHFLRSCLQPRNYSCSSDSCNPSQSLPCSPASSHQRRDGLLRDVVVRRGVVLHHFAVLHVDPMADTVNLGTERKRSWRLSQPLGERCGGDDAVFSKMHPL